MSNFIYNATIINNNIPCLTTLIQDSRSTKNIYRLLELGFLIARQTEFESCSDRNIVSKYLTVSFRTIINRVQIKQFLMFKNNY